LRKNHTYQTSRSSDIALNRMNTDQRYEPMRQSVQQLGQNNKQLKEQLKLVGTNRDTAQFRTDANRNLVRTQDLVKSILSRFSDLNGSPGADNIKFRKLRQVFQQQQSEFNKTEDQFQRLFQNTSVQAKARGKSELATPLLTSDGNESTYQQEQGLTQMKIREWEVDVAEQNLKEIKNIENQIGEVASMYQDFHDIVADQQQDIDDMEDNVVQAKENIEEGARQVDKAASYQRAKRRKMCYILGALVLVAGVVCIVLFTKKK